MSEISIKGKPISSLRVVDLKEELEKRGLSKNGRKDELLQRLQSFLEVNPEEEEEGKDIDGDGTIDVIEASRLEAQQQREQEEAREALKRQEECLRRERELQELRELVGVSPTREEQRKEEEKRQAEEDRLEDEKIEKLKRDEEEKEKRRREQEERERLRQEQEKKERVRLQQEQEKKEMERLKKEEEERKERQAQEERKRKLEEEERLRIEEERKRKEVQRKLEEEQKKIEEEKVRKAAIQKEEEFKRKEEDEKRKQREEELWQEEERKRRAEEKKREMEAENAKEEETASIREENRLKEKLLQRLRDDKEKKGELENKATEQKADNDTKNDDKSKEGSVDGDGGGEEGGGDDTLVMEINQTDLVTFEELSEEKKEEEKPMPAAQPGEVKPLRRLGRNKSGDASGGERRKRGWGATKTSRQSSTENIEVSSNSLKDIVPDPTNLLTKDAAIPEHLELGDEGGVEEGLQNGHKNGDNHEDDDEIGPSLPKQKRNQDTDKSIRKRISLEESTEEESDTILILNLEMLKRTGTIQDFWLNKIKSKCCVQFSSVAEASETRMALNGVTWPVDNKNPLHVIFTTHDNMERLKTSAEEAAERIVVSNGARSGIIPVREWDRDRLPGAEKRRSRSRERRDLKDSSPAPRPVQTKSLEELFNKTKATPALYWKPLSEEVIAKKEEARNRRVMAAGAVPAKSSKRRSRSRS